VSYARQGRNPPGIVAELYCQIKVGLAQAPEEGEEMTEAGPRLAGGPEDKLVNIGVRAQDARVGGIDKGGDASIRVSLTQRVDCRCGEESVADRQQYEQ